MRPQTPPEQALLAHLGTTSYQGTFESHVTTEVEGLEQRERFREVCQQLGVKCVLIELPEGVARSQPMTARHHHGRIPEVVQEVCAICQGLRQAGFSISRIKLEAVASNEGIPDSDEDVSRFPPGNYFEFHVKLALSAGIDLAPLRVCCEQHEARLSRNALKTEQDGRSERFVTLRLYGVGRRHAFARLKALERDLATKGFLALNRQREYTLFDSAEQLDAGWIDRPRPAEERP